jgi:hypothetical protein
MARRTFRTKRIVHLVADDRWQKVRAGLVGLWAKRPEECVERLRTYLEAVPTERAEQRVLNLLTGTGFRCGSIMHRCVNEFRIEVTARLRARGARSAQLRPTHLCPACGGVGWDAFGLCPGCAGKGIRWGEEVDDE